MSTIPTSGLNEGGIITAAGNAAEFKTGDWRSNVPQWVPENCIHCMFCWIYCPDSAVAIDNTGEKTVMTGFVFEHCKGCGICAQHCPPAAKGKAAIVMVRDEK
jgi:pyruvate ferredoxin oxidoreductase delta subunit